MDHAGVYGCFIAAGFYLTRRAFLRPLMQLLFFGGLFTLGMFAFFGVWAAIDFDGLFLAFHQNSFANDLWQLDPDTDYLIMMFPRISSWMRRYFLLEQPWPRPSWWVAAHGSTAEKAVITASFFGMC